MPSHLPQSLVLTFVYFFFFTSYTYCDPQDNLTDILAGKFRIPKRNERPGRT